MPAYESFEVTVIVEVPDFPWVTVTLAAASVKLPPEEPPPDPPTFTVIVPVEDAKVEFPEYVALMTCVPDAGDEKVYVADPFERAREEVWVVPST